MVRSRHLLLIATLSTVTTAQGNLLNGDFETWGAGPAPDHWGLVNTPTSVVQTSSAHCGSGAASVTAGSNWSEFGKQWWFNNGPADTLTVRFRIKCESLTTGATLEAFCEAYDGALTGWPRPPLGGSETTAIVASPHWQEFVLSYRPRLPHNGNTLVRFWLVLRNGSGDSYILDSVDFSGSGPAYGSVAAGTFEESNAKQVMSTMLSLVYDEDSQRIRELRRIGDDGDGDIVAVGADWLVAGQGSNHLFRTIHRPSVSAEEQYRNSADPAFNLVVTPTTVAGASGWNIQSDPSSLFDVSVDLYSLPGQPELFLEPDVQRPANLLLERFECPQLLFKADHDLDGTADDMMLVSPFAGGVLHPLDDEYFADVNAATAGSQFPGIAFQAAEYPGTAAYQMTALYRTDPDQDPEQFGVALQARDDSFQNKSLRVDVHSRRTGVLGVMLGIDHRLPSSNGATIGPDTQSFTRVIAPFVGGWRGAAESYREWIRGTSLWAAASARPTSAWVEERPCVFEANLRPLGIGAELVALGTWGALLEGWRAHFSSGMASGNIQPLFRAFEQHGTYMGPFYEPLAVLSTDFDPATKRYQPLHGEVAILSQWQDLDGRSFFPMMMVAGNRWASVRTGERPACDRFSPGLPGSVSFWNYTYDVSNVVAGTPWDGIVVEDRNGAPRLFPAGLGGWQFSHYEMDPRHPFTVGTHMSLAAKGAAAGVQLYQFDQWLGASVPDNFDPDAAPQDYGAGSWKAHAARNLMEATLGAGRAQSATMQFEVCIEDPTEIAIDILAVQGTRPDNIRVRPAPAYGDAESAPIFAYIFNEVVATTTWDQLLPTNHFLNSTNWPQSPAGYSKDDVRRWHLTEMARTLTAASFMTVGINLWMLVEQHNPTHTCGILGADMQPQSVMDPTLLNFLTACVRTNQGPGRDFLNHGKMVQAPGLQGLGSMQVKLVEGPPGAQTLALVDQPVVHHAAFELPGSVALLLANVDLTTTVNVILPTALGGQSLATHTSFDLHTDGGGAVATAHTLGMSFPVPPQTVCLLVF